MSDMSTIFDRGAFDPNDNNMLPSDGFREIQRRIGFWAEHTYSVPRFGAICAHLLEELQELEALGDLDSLCYSGGFRRSAESQSKSGHAVDEECADIVMIVMSLCHRLDIDLVQAISNKYAINQSRKPAEISDESGVVHLSDVPSSEKQVAQVSRKVDADCAQKTNGRPQLGAKFDAMSTRDYLRAISLSMNDDSVGSTYRFQEIIDICQEFQKRHQPAVPDTQEELGQPKSEATHPVNRTVLLHDRKECICPVGTFDQIISSSPNWFSFRAVQGMHHIPRCPMYLEPEKKGHDINELMTRDIPISRAERVLLAPKTQNHYEAILDQLATIRARKVHQYGESRYEDPPETSLLSVFIDLRRKYQRVKAGLLEGGTGSDSLRDTLLDMANYSIMGVQIMDADPGRETDGQKAWERLPSLTMAEFSKLIG